MRLFMTPIALVLLAACGTETPDDRAIQVISQTGPATAAPISETTPPVVEVTEIDTEIATSIETQPLEVETQPIVNTSAQCDEDQYGPLVGQSAAGRQFPVGQNLRVYGENDIITQELLPQRTNIVVDDAGTIVRVYCG